MSRVARINLFSILIVLLFYPGMGLAGRDLPYDSDTGLLTTNSSIFRMAASDAARTASGQSNSKTEMTRPAASPSILFEEKFEDSNFASRDWYDAPNGVLSATEHIPGSSSSFECRFLKGATGCAGGSPRRHLFTDSDSIYLSYYIKHSSNWAGSGKPYHPHIFHFLTNEDNAYIGPAYTHLTTYVEEAQGYPQLDIQDGQNIDETRVGQDLVGVSESRSVAGCNGVPANIGYDLIDCYLVDVNTHWNGVDWKGPIPYFFNATKTNWHFIESYFKLNTISNGIGQPDGIVQYWYDGQLIIDHRNVILRTGAHPNMKFNQFFFGPYIGDGSPIDQTFWIDNLSVATGRPSDNVRPSPPQNVRIE